MVIDILELASKGRWQTGQLTTNHNMVDIENLAWMGSSGSQGYVGLSEQQTEEGRTEQALFTHPKWVSNGVIKGWLPWRTLPNNAVFEAEIGFAYGAYGTDGVTFQVWEHHMESGRVVWNKIASHRKYYTSKMELISANLSHLSGQSVGIELRVDAGASSGQDWAIWTKARIYSKVSSPDNFSIQISRQPQAAKSESGPFTEEYSPRREYVCQVQHKKMTASANEHLLLNPASDIIWPGSLIDGSSIATGEYKPLRYYKNRAPLTISTSDPSIQGPSYETIENPDLASVREAIKKLHQRGSIGPNVAKANSYIEEIYSKEQLKLAFKAHYNDGVQKIAGNFDFNTSSTKNKVVIKFFQEYYTVDVSTNYWEFFDEKSSEETLSSDINPGQPLVGFVDSPTIIDSPKIIDSSVIGSPVIDITQPPIDEDAMYVASVKYGRMLLITVESEEQMTELKAAAEYSWKELAGGSVDTKYEKILKSSSINGFVMGGSSELGVKTLGNLNGIDGIKDAYKKYIEQGGSAGINNPPAPLSYTLRYLSDGAIGNVLLSTAFKVRNCQKATGTFRVKIKDLICIQWDDEWGEPHEEYYGDINLYIYRAAGDLAFSKKVWSQNREQFVRLRAMKQFGKNLTHEKMRLCTLEINAEEKFTLTDFHNIKDTAYIEVSGILKERDWAFWQEDDTLDSSKKVYLRNAGEDPNGLPKEADELYFNLDNMKAKITFEVEIVS